MSWIVQGRQQHGWFGHGTGGAQTGDDPALTERVPAVAHGAIAALPARLRQRAEGLYHHGTLPALTRAMTVWAGSTWQGRARFGTRFFDDHDTPAVDALFDVAKTVRAEVPPAAQRFAAERLAEAMQHVTIDRWSRFIDTADRRAAAAGPVHDAPGGMVQVAQASGPASAAVPAPPLTAENERQLADAKIAYSRYPNDCSHSVNEYIRLHEQVDEPYRTANAFLEYVRRPGSEWRQVSGEEAQALTNQGRTVVAGVPADPSGHISVVTPGEMVRSNVRDDPTLYPHSMSGSRGRWPGAHSDGSKTVRDAYNAAQAPFITYWARR